MSSDSPIKGTQFSQIPVWVLRSKISDRAVRLFGELTQWVNLPKGAIPGRTTLAKGLGCSVRSINYSIDELKGIGALRVEGRLGTSNQYHLIFDNPCNPVQPPLQLVATPPVQPVAHELDTNESDRSKKQATSAKPRPRNELFDTICEVCGMDTSQLTKTGGARVATALAELKEVGATPEEIRLRARLWKQRFRDAQITPQSLARDWASLIPKRSQRQDKCELCGVLNPRNGCTTRQECPRRPAPAPVYDGEGNLING